MLQDKSAAVGVWGEFFFCVCVCVCGRGDTFSPVEMQMPRSCQSTPSSARPYNTQPGVSCPEELFCSARCTTSAESARTCALRW